MLNREKVFRNQDISRFKTKLEKRVNILLPSSIEFEYIKSFFYVLFENNLLDI